MNVQCGFYQEYGFANLRLLVKMALINSINWLNVVEKLAILLARLQVSGFGGGLQCCPVTCPPLRRKIPHPAGAFSQQWSAQNSQGRFVRMGSCGGPQPGGQAGQHAPPHRDRGGPGVPPHRKARCKDELQRGVLVLVEVWKLLLTIKLECRYMYGHKQIGHAFMCGCANACAHTCRYIH